MGFAITNDPHPRHLLSEKNAMLRRAKSMLQSEVLENGASEVADSMIWLICKVEAQAAEIKELKKRRGRNG